VTEQVIFQQQCFGEEERAHLSVERRRQRHGDPAFAGQDVGHRVVGLDLSEPAARDKEPEGDAQISRIGVRAGDEIAEFDRA
jgi:hypothetical protein